MAVKKFLTENDKQVWPITRADCIYTVMGDKLLSDDYASKDYIDNAIEESVFSGDYNDLENKPCYDDRNYDVIECPEIFDGDISDRIVVDKVASAAISNEEDNVSAKGLTVVPRYVKISDIAPDLGIPMDNPETFMETFMDMMHKELIQIEVCYWDEGVEKTQKGMVTFDYDYIPEIGDYGFIDYYLKLTDMNDTAVAYFVYEEFTYESWGQSLSLTPGVWLIYGVEPNEDYTSSDRAAFYGKTYTIKKYKDGELKELPSKYVNYKPGLRLDGQVIDHHGEELTAGMYAEVFNAVENNIAIGTCSHAEGLETSAMGDYSHAEGSNTTANGNYSHAEGESTYANGDGSHAEGYCTSAKGEAQHVQGKFNIYDNDNKYAHIVGNGDLSARSNAHTLDWSGNAWFAGEVYGTNLPYDTRKIEEVASSSDFDTTTTGLATVSAVYTSDYGTISDTTFIKVSNDVPASLINPKEILSIKYTWTQDEGNGQFYEGPGSMSKLRDTNNENIKRVDEILFVFKDTTLIDAHYNPNSISLSKGIWHLISSQRDITNITYDKNFEIVFASEGEFNTIDAKFVPLKPGLVVTGKSFDYEINGTQYTNKVANYGAEVFNNIDENIAIGYNSHAEGNCTMAIGYDSHAEGCETCANAEHSHAEGYQTYTYQFAGHAEGGFTKAGMYCHAEGHTCHAIGNVSHAEGASTIAQGKYQHVQGKYNEELGNNYAHIVGNGDENKRSNCHTLDWNGNAWFQGKITLGANNAEVATKQDISDAVANATPAIITEEDINNIIANIDN